MRLTINENIRTNLTTTRARVKHIRVSKKLTHSYRSLLFFVRIKRGLGNIAILLFDMEPQEIEAEIKQIYERIFRVNTESEEVWNQKYQHFIDEGAVNLENLCKLFKAQISLFGFTKQQCLDSHETQIRNAIYLDNQFNSND